MEISSESYLDRLLKIKEKQAWIGERSQFDMDEIDIFSSVNFRVSPSFHQKYKVVWFYEHLLSDTKYSHWKILIDEMVRLINEEGFLVIRTIQNSHLTIPLIKNFLGRKLGIDCYIEYEMEEKKTGVWTIIFKIKRYDLEKYKDTSWTMAILTGGKKVDNVVKFLESIRKQDQNNNCEIIISGPQNDKYEKYCVKYLDMSDFRDNEYAEISRKKNAIIDIASNANLLIVHDRYLLSDKFFIGFDQYGYDFDFLTVEQFYEDGKKFPSYCAIEKQLLWSSPIRVDNYCELFDTQYLNGGLLIFKTHIAKKLRFNNLLMWNQMEDVEIAKVAMDIGVIPRINILSSAITIGVIDKYTKDFKVYPKSYIQECDPFGLRTAIQLELGLGGITKYTKYTRFVPKTLKNNKFYQGLKRYMLSR